MACVQGGARRLLGRSMLAADAVEEASELDEDTKMYMVVGFEVLACSIGRTPGQALQDIACPESEEGKPVPPQEITKGMGRSGKFFISAHRLLGLK